MNICNFIINNEILYGAVMANLKIKSFNYIRSTDAIARTSLNDYYINLAFEKIEIPTLIQVVEYSDFEAHAEKQTVDYSEYFFYKSNYAKKLYIYFISPVETI